jgi:hypothetical protein
MNLLLYADKTVNIDINRIARGISSRVKGIKCNGGETSFTVPTKRVVYPDTYKQLPKKFISANRKATRAFCFTKTPYDNNYFFEYDDNIAIISLYTWEKLTSLPMNNGALYFILMVISRNLHFGTTHKRTTGCINDFNSDKTAIDIGMRSAYVCPDCIKAFMASKPSKTDNAVFKALKLLLNELSTASRDNIDIVKYWHAQHNTNSFDVFICHNTNDKKEIRRITSLLKGIGIHPWLDEEQLRPGLPWQRELEKIIPKIGAAAVFVGASGIGPWHNQELHAFLSEFVRRECPVIPVLLPGIKSPPELPIFLNQMTWVDLRKKYKQGLDSLAWGIKGSKPSK